MAVDDMESECEEGQWMLGYIDEPESAAALKRHNFPSKVGGRPAWLDPLNLPTKSQLTCPTTHKARQFLLQVYAAPPAGTQEDHPDAFHRSISLFLSPSGLGPNHPCTVTALRCQLPRENRFYDYEPPLPDMPLPNALSTSDMQTSVDRDPWKVVEWERDLKQGGAGVPIDVTEFPELELIVEPEDTVSGSEAECDKVSKTVITQPPVLASSDVGTGLGKELEGLELKDASNQVTSSNASNLSNAAMKARMARYEATRQAEGELPDEEVDQMDEMFQDAVSTAEQMWVNFQAVTGAAPGSVLRYCRDSGALPLWGRPEPLPGAIPPCEYCGAPRQFEFQVLPQLLNYLGTDDRDADAPDWLTIAVYTCSRSCSSDAESDKTGLRSTYMNEFVFVQPPIVEHETAAMPRESTPLDDEP